MRRAHLCCMQRQASAIIIRQQVTYALKSYVCPDRLEQEIYSCFEILNRSSCSFGRQRENRLSALKFHWAKYVWSSARLASCASKDVPDGYCNQHISIEPSIIKIIHCTDFTDETKEAVLGFNFSFTGICLKRDRINHAAVPRFSDLIFLGRRSAFSYICSQESVRRCIFSPHPKAARLGLTLECH